MPELPEVEAITGVACRHSIDRTIERVEVVRQPANNAYFGDLSPVGSTIVDVARRGKHVIFSLRGRPRYIDCHNAMTGYWDYEDDPWTFDYVEGPRNEGDHVRVKLYLDDGRIMRFHDARFFGRLRCVEKLPDVGPELIATPHGLPGAPVVSLPDFARWILGERRPVKVALMDQAKLAGIGNIYASEACHVAGVDPGTRGCELNPHLVPVLLEALRYVVELQIPRIDYTNLFVYRQPYCGTCTERVVRTEITKRATFICRRCQS